MTVSGALTQSGAIEIDVAEVRRLPIQEQQSTWEHTP